MTGGTDRLIEGLVGDLRPVRPVPPLRWAGLVVGGVWMLSMLLLVTLHAEEPGLPGVGMDRVRGLTALGLTLAALGGTLSALAAGRPGREVVERSGLGVALGGLLLAVGVCVHAWLALGLDGPSPPGADRVCLSLGGLLSVPSGVAVFALVTQGWPARPLHAAAIALLASGALGAIAIHLACDIPVPLNLLRGHVAVPGVLLVIGLAPARRLVVWRREQA